MVAFFPPLLPRRCLARALPISLPIISSFGKQSLYLSPSSGRVISSPKPLHFLVLSYENPSLHILRGESLLFVDPFRIKMRKVAPHPIPKCQELANSGDAEGS